MEKSPNPQENISLFAQYSLKELCVIIMCGFLRIHCKISMEKTPTDIIAVCIIFYTAGDEWDVELSDNLFIHDEGQFMISRPMHVHWGTLYAFGKDTCRRGQQRKWKFKIVDCVFKRSGIAIGIIPRKLMKQLDNGHFDFSYKLNLGNGKVTDGYLEKYYCDPLKINDIIE
eukprot:844260_1